MSGTYDLTQMDALTFESMVNFLSYRVLGKGVTGFAVGGDGGRDGYLEGEAPYPSEKNSWSGTWYIQSKFHKPHLSADPQKWLIQQAADELTKFTELNRTIPDIWILATNIDPSGKPATGAYDKIKKLVKEKLNDNVKFDIWGGRKILDFLAYAPEVASHYGHFLTPGNVLTSLYQSIDDQHAQVNTIIEHLIVSQFNEQNYTKLEQASSNGLTTDTKPKIHQLFVDLPFVSANEDQQERILFSLVCSSAQVHKMSVWMDDAHRYRQLSKAPKTARIFILKGGPGQGKSTVGQYFAQIQRAALILADDGPSVSLAARETAEQLKEVAVKDGFWLTTPRIPALVELKDFATWYGSRSSNQSTGVLSYLAEKISQKSELKVLTGTLRRAFSVRSWFFNFDGLDEVPNDVKDKISDEIIKFSEEILPSIDCDALILCSTRPQGYSGQFDRLESTNTILVNLPKSVALECAKAVVRFGRSESDGDQSEETLNSAMDSPQVRELMTTPLQSHIMAVVVRDGGRPPEKRWELFDNFYKVMKKRESQKNFQDARVAQLLREGDTLLKAIHARLGISLHARAEISEGAETKLDKTEFEQLATQTVKMLMDEAVDDTVAALMEATTERLVFVNTPESHKAVRFDIRQLQEFFAGEFIYSDVAPEIIRSRIEHISADAHWREVMHFFLSALVANNRITDLVNAAEVLVATDTSETCHKTRIYKRRMATGALLALRLLNEGVLEQDKRVRQHFANVVVPLFASLEEQTISQLSAINNVNTKGWLLNQMIEQLFDASEEEQVGAAIALTRSLPDTHPQISRVSEKLAKSSDSYIQTIYKFQLPMRAYRTRKVVVYPSSPDWFIELSLNIIISHAPRRKLDYSVIFKFLRANKYQLFKTSSFQHLPIVETKLLFAMLDIESDLGTSSNNLSSPIVGLTFETPAHTWKSGTIPETLDFIIPDNYPLGTFLDYCASAVRAAQTKLPSDVLRFFSKSREIGAASQVIPVYIQALIPIDAWSDISYDFEKNYKSNAVKRIERLLRTGKLDGRNLYPMTEGISLRGKFTSASWNKLRRDCPALAVGLSFEGIDSIPLHDPESGFSQGIIETAFQSPNLLGPHILKWGELFKLAGDREAELRAYFVDNYETQFRDGNEEFYISNRIIGFALDLKNEAGWLPHIASRLAYIICGSEPAFRLMPAVSLNNADSVREFGLNGHNLSEVFLSKATPFLVRQGALACYYLLDFHQEAHSFSCSSHKEAVSELLNRDAPLWLVSALFRFIERNLSHSDKDTVTFIGYCLDLYRDNYDARARMQPLLSKWRERSSAPLSTSISVDTWLAQQK